ncbi:unnamed protein product [Adineta steineri]|uniref:Uncharacterized protein n=1 Tax=Adineta steineri TaxID=433720 RepID=A0A815NF74_9BILA|nr:unnamed protein product [Adineta steineri]
MDTEDNRTGYRCNTDTFDSSTVDQKVYEMILTTNSTVENHWHLGFEAVYKHNDTFHPHPYILETDGTRLESNTLDIGHYDISLNLVLKRLRDFDIDDLKRYYQAIDKSIDSDEEIQDFHKVYLNLCCKINEQTILYPCNNGYPINLPKFISNPWTSRNTLTRFRYDAENRDGTFPCEMTLCLENAINLQSYKIVLCLITNTIPARMDYHTIRWICKFKPQGSNHSQREKSHNLNHDSGIIVADVFGPELKFTPQMLSLNNPNCVRSCFQSQKFADEFPNSDYRDNAALAVVVTKITDYPDLMKERRGDRNILRYLPFNELDDVNNNLTTSDATITKRLKIHKEQCVKQLIFFDENENGTFSQAHVRVYVAGYDNHDVLLTETLSPPLRNNKIFEPLQIRKIPQPTTELRANDSAYVYCDYDYSKSKSEYNVCPFQFQLVFQDPSTTLNEQLFNKPHICVNASYVNNCPNLLQFTVPNAVQFDRKRVFIRLRHIQSKDYNPSPIALNDTELWIYYADSTTVAESLVQEYFNSIIHPQTTDVIQNIGLEIEPIDSQEDSEELSSVMNTPDIELNTCRRFDFSDGSFRQNSS